MLLGIDVGGTFTDAVIIKGDSIIAHAKTPTTEDLLSGMLKAMDMVLAGVPQEFVHRVALSTTYVTNALVQGAVSPVGLVLIPGPGLDYSGLLPVKPIVLDGYTDHRGRETAPLRREQLNQACEQLARFEAVAVSGKFSIRNPKQENQVADWISGLLNDRHITRGAEVSGGLNFWRRTNSAYFNAAVWQSFGRFADAAEKAIHMRNIQAPIYILKADGGTLQLADARRRPVEAIFTGPAASVLGIMATARPHDEAVSLDIGGTTTDIALWRDGVPLAAPQGVRLAGFPTAVRSFRLRSVGIGGDSVVRRNGGEFAVGPDRLGPAAALGGIAPTLSDAMIVAGLLSFGDSAKASQAIRSVTLPGQTPEAAARQCLEAAADTITREIEAMIAEQYADPVYRVDDILAKTVLQPKKLIIAGGAGKGLARLIAGAWVKRTGCPCTLELPRYSEITNAIGAATARPTLALTVRADSEQGFYSVPELGVCQPLGRQNVSLNAVKQLAAEQLQQQAACAGIAAETLETVLAEEFNLVRGFRTVGKSILVQLQVKPGVLTTIKDKESSE